MNHINHALCNTSLLPAEGDEKDVDTLRVQRGTFQGHNCVRSFWTPTAEELLTILEGGHVCLTVLGNTHAALRLDVITADEGTKLETRGHAEVFIGAAIAVAQANGYAVRVWQQQNSFRMSDWHHAVEVTPRFVRLQAC